LTNHPCYIIIWTGYSAILVKVASIINIGVKIMLGRERLLIFAMLSSVLMLLFVGCGTSGAGPGTDTESGDAGVLTLQAHPITDSTSVEGEQRNKIYVSLTTNPIAAGASITFTAARVNDVLVDIFPKSITVTTDNNGVAKCSFVVSIHGETDFTWSSKEYWPGEEFTIKATKGSVFTIINCKQWRFLRVEYDYMANCQVLFEWMSNPNEVGYTQSQNIFSGWSIYKSQYPERNCYSDFKKDLTTYLKTDQINLNANIFATEDDRNTFLKNNANRGPGVASPASNYTSYPLYIAGAQGVAWTTGSGSQIYGQASVDTWPGWAMVYVGRIRSDISSPTQQEKVIKYAVVHEMGHQLGGLTDWTSVNHSGTVTTDCVMGSYPFSNDDLYDPKFCLKCVNTMKISLFNNY